MYVDAYTDVYILPRERNRDRGRKQNNRKQKVTMSSGLAGLSPLAFQQSKAVQSCPIFRMRMTLPGFTPDIHLKMAVMLSQDSQGMTACFNGSLFSDHLRLVILLPSSFTAMVQNCF